MVRNGVVFLFFISLLLLACLQSPSDAYSVQAGRMHYPENRPVAPYNATVLEDAANHTLTYLTYASHGGVTVHALLRVPKTWPNGTAIPSPPVVILLPGASITKEGRQPLAHALQDAGFATLVLDERGNGKTPRLHSLDDDYGAYLASKEPEEAQMAYDALAAFDLLSEARFGLDPTRVALWGESMGGRYAIIAAALEPKIMGVVLVSSAGLGLPTAEDASQTAFLRLIDADNYVAQIAPRPVYFMHNPADTVIPIASAQATYGRALPPKGFTRFDCTDNTVHGWCPAVTNAILADLRKIFG